MPLFMLASMAVNAAIGAALLLAWRHERSQPFTRWIGLSFLTNVLWVPGYLIFFQVPQFKWFGAVLWTGQFSLSLTMLLMGISQLHGTPFRENRLYMLGGMLFLVLLICTQGNPRLVSAMTALLFNIVAIFVARLLLQGQWAQRLAGILLVGHALAWWITPALGFHYFPLQSLLVTLLRLLLGLALLYACLRHAALEAKHMYAQFMRLTESAHQGVVVIQNNRIVYANPEALRLFGLPEQNAKPLGWSQRGLDSPGCQLIEEHLKKLHKDDLDSITWAQTWQRPDGAERRLRFTSWLIDWQESPAEQLVINDETELYSAEQRLIHQASHDRLTGLLNRFGIEEFALEALVEARPHAVLLINIDRFSTINHALGYQSGDELLKLVSARIRLASGPRAGLARLSRDEFVVLLPLENGRESAGLIAASILTATSQPYQLGATGLNITASIGVALCPGDGDSFERLLAQASLAVKNAKEAGQNTLRFFDGSMDSRLLEEIQLSNDLHGALQRNEIELFLQPVMDIRKHCVTGAEALLRWHHPTRGLISPGLFIPIAERTGSIIEIGGWVIEEACRILDAWQASSDLCQLTLSINVSAKQFTRGDVDQVVAQALDRYRPPAHLLELEITESALINNPEQFVGLLARLRRLGVGLAIDDFGTGYSNLSYLQRFQVDKLKVDQSFVRDLIDNPQSSAIVHAVIQMAASLGLKTTAEGIENGAVLETLHSLGCDQAQGYHFSPPLTRAGFENWCMRQRTGTGEEGQVAP